jgi:hypothetical protein
VIWLTQWGCGTSKLCLFLPFLNLNPLISDDDDHLLGGDVLDTEKQWNLLFATEKRGHKVNAAIPQYTQCNPLVIRLIVLNNRTR